MAEVLAEHQCFETYYTNNKPYLCNCGERFQDIHAHQEVMLAANGYGKLEDAWGEGYTTGNAHNGRRDANPYRRPE